MYRVELMLERRKLSNLGIVMIICLAEGTLRGAQPAL